VPPVVAEQMLGVSHKRLYTGELDSFTLGRARKITVASIRAHIAAKLARHPKSPHLRRG